MKKDIKAKIPLKSFVVGVYLLFFVLFTSSVGLFWHTLTTVHEKADQTVNHDLPLSIKNLDLALSLIALRLEAELMESSISENDRKKHFKQSLALVKKIEKIGAQQSENYSANTSKQIKEISKKLAIKQRENELAANALRTAITNTQKLNQDLEKIKNDAFDRVKIQMSEIGETYSLKNLRTVVTVKKDIQIGQQIAKINTHANDMMVLIDSISNQLRLISYIDDYDAVKSKALYEENIKSINDMQDVFDKLIMNMTEEIDALPLQSYVLYNLKMTLADIKQQQMLFMHKKLALDAQEEIREKANLLYVAIDKSIAEAEQKLGFTMQITKKSSGAIIQTVRSGGNNALIFLGFICLVILTISIVDYYMRVLPLNTADKQLNNLKNDSYISHQTCLLYTSPSPRDA